MTCLHAPVSLADAEAIAVCYGGSDWRSLALLGLGTVAAIGALIVLAVVLLRGIRP